MSKMIVPSLAMKKLALETIIELAGIVKQTLGPGGNPIIIQRDGSNPDGSPKSPLITKDGVSVAESIRFADSTKNTIAQAIIQVSKDTVNEAGDGTTTAMVLAEAIYRAGYKYVDQGTNSIRLYEELKALKDDILAYVDHRKEKVSLENIFEIAKISANGDEAIAQIVADAIDRVGEDGHITLEEGYGRDTVLDLVEGSVYKQGYRAFSPQGHLLVTDKAREMAVLRDAGIVLYNGKLDSVAEISAVLIKLYEANQNTGEVKAFPLLFIATDYSEEVKNFILQNKVQANLPIAAIKIPFDGSPNARTGILEDLAVLTGGTVLSRGIRDLATVTRDDLGSAGKIEISANETVFFDGRGDEQEIISRVEELKTRLDETPHAFDKDNLRIRIGKLVGGIAVIKVGGDSELEILEKKDRIEDALCAAKVALADGMVPGGGSLLYNWVPLNPTGSIAEKILLEALKEPFNQIVRNVGENPELVAYKVQQTGKAGAGYNAREKTIVSSMIGAGIIDPAKVTKATVENAISIAGLLLTTGGAVVNATLKDGEPNPFANMFG